MSQGSTISAIIPSAANANVVIDNVSCDSTVYAGAAVYMDATGTAYNAIATSLSTSNVLGIVESKASPTECAIRVLGVSGGLYTSLDTTKEYFLSDSTAGLISVVVPTASGSVVLKIGQPYSSSEMMILKGTRTVRL